MAKLRHSLIWRLSLGLLTILILLGIAYVTFTASSARSYFQETTQRLNAQVAEQMLLEVNPFVDGEVNDAALGKIMHSMMAVNPSLEVYLLDPTGNILSYVVLHKKVRLKSVNLEPVLAFLDKNGNGFFLGDDPRQPGNEIVFSATAVEEDGVLLGYVYMVLASEKYEDIADALATSYFIKIGTTSFLLTLVFAFGLGIMLIFLLTKNLRKISEIVKRFAEGDYQARIPISKNDEMAVVASTFNNMADTILANMEDLKQVDSLRRELIANVSHDLRSPMSVIHGYIETLLIKEDSLTSEQRGKYLKIILRNSDRLQKLIADLFELSKLESGQVKLKLAAYQLDEQVQYASETFALKAKEKGIEIQLSTSGEIPRVMADADLINRVIQNLVENAVKYTPDNGQISLRTELKNDHVEIQIKNSGPGISQVDLPLLFERYYQPSNTKVRTRSTGLGLAIVKKIMDLHRAVINVESIENGLTVFKFSLPLA